MLRRPLALLVVSLTAVVLSACADATAPTSPASSTPRIQAAGQPSLDVTDPGTCRDGYMTSTGKAC